MRHQKTGVKLNRTSSHRKAMFRNMVTSLFEHGQLKTTDAKAKELRRWADKMITLAKRGDLHARRQVLSVMRNKDIVHKLFESAAERFGTIPGGYTRITKIGFRKGDAAPISLVDFVGGDEIEKGKKGSWLSRVTGRGKDKKVQKPAEKAKAPEPEKEEPKKDSKPKKKETKEAKPVEAKKEDTDKAAEPEDEKAVEAKAEETPDAEESATEAKEEVAEAKEEPKE